MALGKVFNMGGLYQGPTKQAQPPQNWRRLLNVWQDRSGKFRPKGEQVAFATPVSPFAGTITQVVRTGFSRRFQDKIFSVHIAADSANPTDPLSASNFFSTFNKSGTDITPAYNKGALLSVDRGEWVFGRSSYPNTVVGNKIFFKAGNLPLLKYDGVQVLRAGLALPRISCAQYNSTPTHWIKVVNVRVGFDGAMIASGVVKFPVNNTNITIGTSFGTGTDLVGQASVTPTNRDSLADSDKLDDMRWMEKTGAWTNASATTISTSTTAHNLVSDDIGNWLMFSNIDATSLDSHIYAMRITAIAGATITFSNSIKKYLKNTLSWVDADIDNTIAPFDGGLSMVSWSSTFMLVYSSTTENGTFKLCAQRPLVRREETLGSEAIPNITTYATTYGYFAGQTTQDIQGWYDIGTVKLPFPFGAIDANTSQIMGLTKYQGLLISYDKKAIYFNDFSSGGSDEMINGLTNFVPLGTEYGDIVAVEGCEDFIFISRERKNYVLVGDLATGNFVINECDAETASALGSNATIASKGVVVYMGRQGVFAVSSSGTITELSEAISRLFGASREFVTDPDSVAFQPYRITDDVPSDGSGNDGWDGNIVKMKYDADRNLIAILYGRKTAVGAAAAGDHYGVLAINLKTGNCYEWKLNQVADLDVVVHDIEFLESYDATSGKFKGSLIQAGSALTREDNTQALVQDMYLISSWQTGDEPSLEKQATQLKFYGQMTGCRVFHQENWEAFTSIAALAANRTNVLYPTAGNQNTNLFEHKQRLNSSRAQTISIGIAPTDNNFSLEGYELEWEQIQGSMKK